MEVKTRCVICNQKYQQPDVVVVVLFNVHGKQLSLCQDGHLT